MRWKIRLQDYVELLIGVRDVSIRSNEITSKGHRYYSDRAETRNLSTCWLEQIVSRGITCKSVHRKCN